ncbi:MAG: TraR/DksA family transcriptional regulator [Planctomycetota bacterium JB042]
MPRSKSGEFLKLLFAKREALVGDLRSMESQAFKTSGQDSAANHMADFGSDNYEQEFTLGLIENDQEIVHLINEALLRIENGEYGLCLECYEPIPNARLEVLPWTPFCVRCQEIAEKY